MNSYLRVPNTMSGTFIWAVFMNVPQKCLNNHSCNRKKERGRKTGRGKGGGRAIVDTQRGREEGRDSLVTESLDTWTAILAISVLTVLRSFLDV